MMCPHPGCTGVHDNNRYHELCPRSLSRKRDKDDRYYASNKGCLNRLRKTQWAPYGSAAYAEMEEWINSGKLDEIVRAAEASGDAGPSFSDTRPRKYSSQRLRVCSIPDDGLANMPRPKTVGRCATKGCKGRWQITPRNKRQQFCPTCSRARKRVRDREHAKAGRLIRKRKARERRETVLALAWDYEDTGWLDTYQHGSAPYSVKEWAVIVAEAKALAEAWMSDEEYQEAMDELRAQDAAEEAAWKAGQLAALEEALVFVTEMGDQLGVRIVRERIAALTGGAQPRELQALKGPATRA